MLVYSMNNEISEEVLYLDTSTYYLDEGLLKLMSLLAQLRPETFSDTSDYRPKHNYVVE